jgi:hypothetical protein
VPTVTFQLLYCFFVIEHGRRKILHFNVTAHPTSDWVLQQLREALPAGRVVATSAIRGTLSPGASFTCCC